MKSFNSKNSRKLNNFYLDNINDINLCTTSIQQISSATNVITSVYNDKFLL